MHPRPQPTFSARKAVAVGLVVLVVGYTIFAVLTQLGIFTLWIVLD